MSEDIKDSVNQDINTTVSSENEQEKIEYAKYRALLDEKKKEQQKLKELTERLEAIEAEKIKAEEDKLKASNQFKELYESKAKELERLNKERELEKQAFIEHKKLDAFIKEVGGIKKPEYISLIDTSKIITDENGDVNTDSVKMYAESFKKQFSEVVDNKVSSHLNQQAPKINGDKSLKTMNKNELFKLMKG